MTTHAGPPAQDNSWTASWPRFFAHNRLRNLAKYIERKQPGDADLVAMVDKVASVVVPRLLGNGHLGGKAGIKPVLVHGDLWSGNKARGVIEGRGEGVDEYAFDSPCSYAHSEYDLAPMRMFGGFSTGFFSEYHNLVPRTHPVEEYDDRMELYQLYVLDLQPPYPFPESYGISTLMLISHRYFWLMNYAAHGGGYRDDCIDNMQKLWR